MNDGEPRPQPASPLASLQANAPRKFIMTQTKLIGVVAPVTGVMLLFSWHGSKVGMIRDDG